MARLLSEDSSVAFSQVHYCRLLSLGIPVVVGQIGNIVLGFADTLMIGRYGMKELAAAGFVNNLIVLVIVFALGFSYGLTPVVGQMFGRGEYARIGGALRGGLVSNTFIAVLLIFVSTAIYVYLPYMGQPHELLSLMRPYLMLQIISLPFICWINAFKQFYDAIGHTRMPMIVLILGNFFNIVGNYMLIYGHCGMPELGLVGAGVSTLLSRILMLLFFMLAFMSLHKYGNYRKGFFAGRTEYALFNRLNALGWPLAMQMGMETAAFSLTAVFVGWIGTRALAAHQVAITISQLFFMVYYGMAAAVAVRISHFFGQKDIPAVRLTAKAGFHIILVVACVISVPIFIFRNQLGLIFTDDTEVCRLVAIIVIPLIIYQFGDGLQCTYSNAMRGISQVKPLVWIAFISYFVVSLPLSWLLGIYCGYGLVGIWSAFPVSLMCAGILYFIMFKRLTDKQEKQQPDNS
ncbi:MAG: MATE family efflux transporter [Prevotella sp.]